MKIHYIGALLLCIGWMTSCEDERFDTGKTAMPDGQFIVDYTADTGTSTRALSEDVPAGKRINSLTYLLYSEEGTLLKRREIPGLNEPGIVEEWPLTRENMTWEQREALKDTLETNTTYHAVFIANIDSTKLWKDATTDNLSPLKCAGNYNDAYIELPDRAFTDGDMFYYFSKDINSVDEGADRDNPYHCNVQLHRIVTRTDFFFEELPVWEGVNTEDEPATALLRDGEVDGEEEGSGNNEEQNGGELGGEGSGDDETGTEGSDESTEDEGGTTEDEPEQEEPSVSVPSTDGNESETETGNNITYPEVPSFPATSDLPEVVQNYLLQRLMTIGNNANTDYLAKIVEGTVALLNNINDYLEEFKSGEEPNITYTYEAEMNAIKELIGEINTQEGQITFISNLLSNDTEGNLMAHLNVTLLNLCAQNKKIQELWKQSVRATGEKGWWAEVFYQGGSRVNQFFINKTVKHSAGNAPRVEADAKKTEAGITYRGFNLVGFADPTQNIINEIKWYASETSTDIVQTLKRQKEGDADLEDDPIQTGQGINEKYVVTYRPINELTVVGADTKSDIQVVCDLTTALPFEAEGKDNLLNAIKKAFAESQDVANCGKSLDEVILTTTLPDLSKSDVLKITPEWTIEGGNN